MKRFVGPPSPAMVVALIALFVASGGTGYAAFTLSKDSVGTRQLKNGAVTKSKLRNGSVTADKLRNGAVGRTKLNLVGVTVPNARSATTAGSANYAGDALLLDGLASSSFVQGTGQVFAANRIVTADNFTPFVNVPGIGELDASYSSGGVSFYLSNGTNQTGQAVDETVEHVSSGSDDFTAAQIAAGDVWQKGGFGGPLGGYSFPSVVRVQFGWGSGSTAHVVTMTVSLIAASGGAEVTLQGLAS